MSSGKLKPVPWLSQASTDKPYYERGYAEQIQPRATVPRTNMEKLATYIVAVIAFLNYAYVYSPGWLLENNRLNGVAMRKHTKQTLWFRRMMPLESFFALPAGMAAWLVSHLYAGFGERGVEGMSMPLMAGYNMHMAHMNSFFQAAQPFLMGRLTYIVWQILACPFILAGIVIAPQLMFLVFMYTDEWMCRLYTDFLQDIDKGQAPELLQMSAPEASKKSYGLPDRASFRDAVMAWRADHAFMAELFAKAAHHKDDPFKH